MKKLALVLLFVPIAAFAGKEEREFIKDRVKPAVTKAEESYKTHCGCALKVTVDETALKTVEELRKGQYIADDVAKGAEEYCKDVESKKAVCKMKTLKISKGSADFKFAGSAGTATTDGQANASWDMMTKELDK